MARKKEEDVENLSEEQKVDMFQKMDMVLSKPGFYEWVMQTDFLHMVPRDTEES